MTTGGCLRVDAFGGRLGRLSPAALQVIAGFDAVVVLGGSAPSHPLAEPRPPRMQARDRQSRP